MTEEIQRLTFEDMQLLLSLQDDPLQTYTNLSSKIGKSVKTVSSWVSNLEKRELMYPTRALLNLPALGLEMVDVIFSVPSLKKLKLLESLCYNHPYTSYRGRMNGATNGLFVQFLSPINAINNYQELINELLQRKVINKGEIHRSISDAVNSKFDLKYWNNRTMEWNFDWTEWAKSLDSIDKIEPYARKMPINRVKDLDLIDVYLLRILNQNVKLKLKEIVELLKSSMNIMESQQRISERLQKLKKWFISDYRINLNPKVLDLYNTLLFNVDCTEDLTNRLKIVLKEHPPPFTGYFKERTGGFLWYLRIPSTHFSKVTSIIWEDEAQRFDVSFLDYSNSMTYSLWEQTFDEENHSWKDSKDFMVDIPINQTFKK